METKFFKGLLEYIEEFEDETNNKNATVQEFSYWLHNRVCAKPRSYNEELPDKKGDFSQQPVDVQISILIGRMAKYARVYTKKNLSDNGLSGLDDYGFMATLMFHPSMTKTELTHHNLTEPTSGADIIRRLIKSGYVEEFDDEQDKRSRRVKITEKGKQVMFEVFKEMTTTSHVISGNLSHEEKLYLLHYLNKLEQLHKTIYNEDRKSDLHQIEEKYIHPAEEGES